MYFVKSYFHFLSLIKKIVNAISLYKYNFQHEYHHNTYPLTLRKVTSCLSSGWGTSLFTLLGGTHRFLGSLDAEASDPDKTGGLSSLNIQEAIMFWMIIWSMKILHPSSPQSTNTTSLPLKFFNQRVISFIQKLITLLWATWDKSKCANTILGRTFGIKWKLSNWSKNSMRNSNSALTFCSTTMYCISQASLNIWCYQSSNPSYNLLVVLQDAWWTWTCSYMYMQGWT